MTKAMIVTVGTGPTVEKGISKSIHQSNPEYIVFLCSQKSEEITLPLILKVLREEYNKELSENSYEVILFGNEYDIEKCQDQAKEVFNELLDRYSLRDISIDFTGGTKSMSSGTVLAGVEKECQALIYVTGDYNENGRVIDGTERPIFTTPTRMYVNRRRRLIVKLFNSYQFDATFSLFDDVEKMIGDKEILAEFRVLKDLCEGYSQWDRFNHKKAFEILNGIEKKTLGKLGLGKNIIENKEILYSIKRSNGISVELVPDLLENVSRRDYEGKYDDAVARLYRCIEFIGQLRLWDKFEMKSDDIKLEKIPKDKRENYEKLRGTDRKISVAQKKVYELLRDLGDNEIANMYFGNDELKKITYARNNSILAHGFSPINKDICENFIKICEKFARMVIKNYDVLRRKCKFPALM